MNAPIPLRPDPSALARSALTSVARAALWSARSWGKSGGIKNPWPDDAAVNWLQRSPVSPTRIQDITALTQVRVHFLPSLVPQSAAAAILSAAIGFSFDGVASISVPSMSIPTAGFIGEGQAIPVLDGTTSANVPITPAKLAALITLTREMIEGGDAENAVRQVLLENVGPALDYAFFNGNAAVPTVSPAGILWNVTPLNASGRIGTSFDACVVDLANLMQALGAVSGNSKPIIIAAPQQASVIASVIIDPPPVYISNALPAGTIVAIVPASLAVAVGMPLIEASREVTLHMANPASDIVAGSPGVVAAGQKSMFQTDSSALRFLMDLTWTRRSATNGVQFMQGVNWP
jgi:hypothetical protein